MLDITQWESNIKIHSEDNYNEGSREDHYELAKVLLEDILITIEKSSIVEIWRVVISCGIKNYRWYKDDKIIFDTNDINQHSPISLCNTIDSEIINYGNNFNLEHIKKVRGNEVFTPKLQELNNNRIKYGRAHGMMKKVIDLALATNSYEELVGMCQDFLNSKQEILTSQNLVNGSISNKELEITNPVITVRKGRPTGRAKSAVEIQDKENKKPVLNIQRDGNNDNRRKCHKCGQKGHNRTTSEIDKERRIEGAPQEPRPNRQQEEASQEELSRNRQRKTNRKKRRIEGAPQEPRPNRQQEETSQEELSRNRQRKTNRRSTTRTTTKSPTRGSIARRTEPKSTKKDE
ncbi:hypothetical protein Glove_121g20 [Diversispora epigaea]|uniref:CCHC-type domain-containing protein n=1 Tax=Diversispora epigaea TaxID=1348612 RepID=A0A397J853_9GLOM|nr:hypothetical protein Glove_121g20 [Diversispora epigaea]